MMNHFERVVDIIEQGFHVQFMAKDTHYYWGSDNDAILDSR